MKCWVCGEEATKTMAIEFKYGCPFPKKLSSGVRCYCDKCFDEVREQKRHDEAEYVRLKKKAMYDIALGKLESQNVNMYKLKPSIDKVREYLFDNLDKFDSSYEIMTAIILIDAGVKFQLQKKILQYQVDVYIPSHKIIVEIDGDRHKNRKSYDNERDEKILDAIGYDWNIVRIPTEHLDNNATKLVKAIDHVVKYRATGKIPWRSL